MSLAAGTALAADPTANLGGGLKQLVAPPVAARAFARSAAPSDGSDIQLTSPVEFDDANRALVRISLDGSAAAAKAIAALRALQGVDVVASDLNYGPGVVEAYVPVEQLVNVAQTSGVLAVVPSSPMVTNVGTATSQGVVQHRVDKLPPGVDGSGITVGVMSDSYDTNGGTINAASDIATGDLPGTGNPFGNTEPVVVLQDSPGRSDEGRAMLQIVHDLAPKAKLGFATAQGGQINFANNIRALAGDPTAPNYRAGFKADVIVDDIIYLDEPFFQDGLVAQAVDEVVAKGVSYFSSAGNRPASQGYDAKVNLVPGTPASWAGTNLDFSRVPAALYAGGFHNYATNGTVDIAQTVNFSAGSSNNMVLQWNEPFDSKPPTAIGAPFAAGTGTVPDGGFSEFTFTGTAGQAVLIFVDADTTTTGTPIPDTVLELYNPSGALIATKDTGTNPEQIALELPAAGTYRVRVLSFEPTGGDYRYTVSNADLPEPVLSDYNILFFLSTGQYVGALAEQNTLTNRPLELGGLNPRSGTVPIQVVIARANTPTPSRKVADRIRWVGFGAIAPQEYISYIDPVTYGHNSAAGAIGVAAYPFYAPFVPESFTSPGPSTIYFDKNSRRLRHVEIRQKPDLAAMDGANTTFFTSDTIVDDDTLPNFFGTSAAAPHAAAIAALVLDAAGGPGSVKPWRMRDILQSTAFPHDLDPYFSWGLAYSRGNFFAIDATADGNSISQFDPNVFSVTQFGRNALASLSINGVGANPTNSGAIVFDERGTPASAPPGQPFIVGRTEGLTAADVTAKFSLPADPPGVAGQWKQLDLSFLPGSFASGDSLNFGVDRDESDVAGPSGAAGGNSADLLGGGVLIPSGKIVPGGARFFGTFEGGGTFSGQFYNLIGRGYSPLDGYGFINAEAAVKAVQRKRY